MPPEPDTPPEFEIVFVEVAVHEPEIPDPPPEDVQLCLWLVVVTMLTPLLVWACACITSAIIGAAANTTIAAIVTALNTIGLEIIPNLNQLYL